MSSYLQQQCTLANTRITTNQNKRTFTTRKTQILKTLKNSFHMKPEGQYVLENAMSCYLVQNQNHKW